MKQDDPERFLYLNREGRWLGFERHRLEPDESGTLRLASVPLRLGELPEGLSGFPAPDGPAGVTVAPDGTVYFSDPAGNRLLRIDTCEEAAEPVPCLGGGEGSATRLREPRGLLYHPRRHVLLVADSANHRVVLFDPATFRLLDEWDELDTPWTLAGDADGSVYVVDYGGRRLLKFDVRGRLAGSFRDAIQAGPVPLTKPTDVAVATRGRSTEVFVLDAEGPDGPRVVVFDPQGDHLRTFDVPSQRPMGLGAAPGTLYLGDNTGRALIRLEDSDGTLIGRARGYEGPVAALALDARGTLWLHPGTGCSLVRLGARGAHVARGFARAGPFANPAARATFRDEEGQARQWHRVKARLEIEGEGAHGQVFVHTSPRPAPPPVPAEEPPPFPGPEWKAFPLDSAEGLLPGRPGDQVSVAIELTSIDGLRSPALSQVRLDFDLETPVQYLPAIYREDPRALEFLARLLFLSNAFFEDVESTLARLPQLFDPHGAPAPFLPWLAGWLAVDLRERWPEGKQREAIAGAFERHARRGTAAGLREALRFEADVEARVEEPILQSAWWSLPGSDANVPLEARGSSLGFTTRLVAGPAEGAVLGTTAVLEQSHLIRAEERGSPLFDDVAHQFLVQVSGTDEAKTQEIRALVEREKPAHTAFHLCVVEPLMRVGFQALLGIDTIVAGAPLPSRLGDPSGDGFVLGGEPAGRLGRASRVGETTRLGAGPKGELEP